MRGRAGDGMLSPMWELVTTLLYMAFWLGFVLLVPFGIVWLVGMAFLLVRLTFRVNRYVHPRSPKRYLESTPVHRPYRR